MYFIIKVSQLRIHHRLEKKDFGNTTTKSCLTKTVTIIIAGLPQKNALIFTEEETLHVFRNALNSATFGNKMLLPKMSVNIPLISTTESSNPLGKRD